MKKNGRKKILCFLLFMLPCPAMQACDVCGTSAGSQSMGLLPQVNGHFLSLGYQNSIFTSRYASLFDKNSVTQYSDNYRTLQLWGRYAPAKRLQVFTFIPYQHNTRKSGDAVNTSSGIGDMLVLANYALLPKPEEERRWKHNLLAGGGLKMPTGRNGGIMESDLQGVPNMQPGTGSWDFILNGNYTVTYQRTGINLDISYSLTTANRHDYKYGNRLNCGLLLFHTLQKKQWSLIPQAGMRYEYALHDYDNYSRKWLNEQSGGYLYFVSLGAQVFFRGMGARVQCSLPVAQQYSGGNVTARHRMETSLFFLF